VSRSEDLYERAQRVVPGGVHSPVRAFRGLDSGPIFVESAAGARITDVDGNSYVDFCMAFGPLILGHAHPEVRAAVATALDRGWSYGAAESVSLELAELITNRVDFVDSIRFVNSGTEAVMSALRLARAATGRDKIVKFAGCYHGHTDAMLIKAGSGLAGLAVPDSAGVPQGVAADTLVAPLDDETKLTELFDHHGREIAAVIIEPVPANHGLLPQRTTFVQHVANLCRENHALLIFDEVITGFRLAFGGYAQLAGMHPDLVTWGKVIGGGFPVGAIGGRRELMEQFAPDGPVYQAGTLSANPIAMTAGLTTLQLLTDGEVFDRLESLGRYLDESLRGAPGLRLQRCGSLFWLSRDTTDAPATIRSTAAIPSNVGNGFRRIFSAALRNGVYLPPSPFEVGFLSTAHSRDDIDQLAGSLDRL